MTSAIASPVSNMCRGKSSPLLTGADNMAVDPEVELIIGVAARIGVGSCSLLHAGCVPVISVGVELLLPLLSTPPLDPCPWLDPCPRFVDVEAGVGLPCEGLLLASIVGVLVTCQVLVPSGTRAYD